MKNSKDGAWGAAEYLLKEQEESICSKGGLRHGSVCALKDQHVLLTPRSSAQDGPGGTHRSRKALDSGCQRSCADPHQPGQSWEKLALPPCPAQSSPRHPHLERAVEGVEPRPRCRAGLAMSFSRAVGASRGFQRHGSGEQAGWRGEGSRGDRADPSGAMQGNGVPPLRR